MKPKTKRLLRYLLLAVVVIAIGVAIKMQFFSKPPAPEFTTAEVTRGDLEKTVLATGTMEAYKLVSVGAQASGQLKSLKVGLGDEVKAGQLLAEIDSMTQQNALRNAEAALETKRAQRAAQVANLKQAEREFERQKMMLAKDASPRQDYEAAEASLTAIKAQIAALDAEIRQAGITADTAKVNLGYTRILAPMDGTIVAEVAKEGQTINANQQAPTIFKLAQLDTLTIKSEISEADVIRVKPGQEVYFTILGEPDTRHEAKLRSVEPAPESIKTESTTTSNNAASTAVYYNGLFDVPNKDRKLRIGMTAQVYIVLDKVKDAVLVPSAAVRQGERGATVRVLDGEGKPQVRRVKLGLDNNINAQILEGVQPGEKVVVGSGQRGAGAGNRQRQGGQPQGMPRMRF